MDPGIKLDTNTQWSLEPGFKLAITPCHLASGDKYTSMKLSFKVQHNIMLLVVHKVCQAIIEEYCAEVVSCPTTPDEWWLVTEKFVSCWNFPHICRALDDKHIFIRKARNSRTLYHIYKDFYSVVLMGLITAEFKFTWRNVGGNGHIRYTDLQYFRTPRVHCRGILWPTTC